METEGEFARAHRQPDHRVRLEWGPTGAAALAEQGSTYAVVVDVLSFTTTVTVALDHGIEVFPYRWRDSGAAAHAMRHGATLAVGRFEALGREGRHVSLSPASLRQVAAEPGQLTRLVLPSPNGSTICFDLAERGPGVVAASLRNRYAVAQWLARQAFVRRDEAEPLSVAVIAAGERWPDGSLRPAVEDLWGAGAVLAALDDLGLDDLSPEASMAVAAFRAVEPDLAERLDACASGRELADKGFADDVAVAAELDSSSVVPMLVGESFTDAAAP
ncbi:2-phosphosulfolactate phosphatase [Nocardioides sp. AE5]|uniref:2-phosphosulfolactate phosphatase n=1 Tax=Nocardioides sp. AE5 TaxID=2962573 RepID=UPI0028826222|nr:2-phosphosulfolactate phosphatase [Nocardioides sp. AE5]MDT0202350.1 2-phosphosulfolactate phosphatase [Nocardioides sp. AE5]